MLFHRTEAFSLTPIGQASAENASPPARKNEQQYALHVIDYIGWKALADLRAMGACNRRVRKLTDNEFDDNQFSIENGDGSIY